MQFTYGHTTDYLYDAAESKLNVADTTVNINLLVPMGKTVPVQAGDIFTTMKTDYCGNIIYEDGVLSKILTEEGYVTLSGFTAVFHYYLKDHEGNNRVVLNQNGTVEQVNNYYPFGGLYGDNTGGSTQPYMYNGKKLDRMHGLDLFDYGARHYDAALGRWFTMDPMGEKYFSISPYGYCAENPVRFIDSKGEDLKDILLWTATVIGGVGTAITGFSLIILPTFGLGQVAGIALVSIVPATIGLSIVRIIDGAANCS